jgi:hypothetical protein
MKGADLSVHALHIVAVPRLPARPALAQVAAGFGGPPKMLAALRFSAFAFSFSA